MAERRMFSTRVIQQDDFYDMSKDAQLLYFHLGLAADDEGFVNNPRMILRSLDIDKTALDELTSNNFIIRFDKCLAIVHWHINNTIRPDRKHPTNCQHEFSQLVLDEETKLYRLKSPVGTPQSMGCQPNDNQMATNGQPNDRQLPAQYSIVQCIPDKCNSVKDNLLDSKLIKGEDRGLGEGASMHHPHQEFPDTEQFCSLTATFLDKERANWSQADKESIMALVAKYGDQYIRTLTTLTANGQTGTLLDLKDYLQNGYP